MVGVFNGLVLAERSKRRKDKRRANQLWPPGANSCLSPSVQRLLPDVQTEGEDGFVVYYGLYLPKPAG